jgi:hypothetical protein
MKKSQGPNDCAPKPPADGVPETRIREDHPNFAETDWDTVGSPPLSTGVRKLMMTIPNMPIGDLPDTKPLNFSALGWSMVRPRSSFDLVRPQQLDASRREAAGGSSEVWLYSDQIRDRNALASALSSASCIFCSSCLERPGRGLVQKTILGRTTERERSQIQVCPLCGWWRYEYAHWKRKFAQKVVPPSGVEDVWAAAGSLKNLDLRDQSIPISEIRRYLIARYKQRYSLDPTVFEGVGASVFRDTGYESLVTGRRGDGGIDVILHGPDSSIIGVQVKRYRNKIR